MNLLNGGFASHSNIAFLRIGRNIVSALSHPPGSTDFPTAAALVTEIHDLLDVFEAAILLGNAPGARSDRRAARATAANSIQQLAARLQNVSRDRTQLAHTGFPLRKIWTRDRSQTGTPQNVIAKPTGIPSEVKLSAIGIPNARLYQARATQDMTSGNFIECDAASSIRKLRFSGLERGKDWFFQIRALSPNGPSPWSDPAMMMVV